MDSGGLTRSTSGICLREYTLPSNSLFHAMNIQSKTHLEADSLKDNNIAIGNQHYRWHYLLWHLFSLCHQKDSSTEHKYMAGKAFQDQSAFPVTRSEVAGVTAKCTNFLPSGLW